MAIDIFFFRNNISNYVGESTSTVAHRPTYTIDRLDDQLWIRVVTESFVGKNSNQCMFNVLSKS